MENFDEENGGGDVARSEGSNLGDGERQSSPETPMDVEGEASHERLSPREDESLTKRELFRIIADQDRAIAALRREIEGGRSEDMMTYNPGIRKRERANEDSESMQYGIPQHADLGAGYQGRPRTWRQQAEPQTNGVEEPNMWAPRRLEKRFGVRQPLARNILMEPAGTTIPPLPSYDGVADPEDHLNSYFTKMQLYNSSDATLCKVFPSTFAGVVLDWYHQINEGRIECFEQFAELFLSKFASRKRRTLTIGALFKVRQREGEALREFYDRWISVAMEVKDVQPAVLGVCLDACTTSEELCRALSKRDVVSTEDLDRRVQKVIMLEETLAARRAEKRRMRGEEIEGRQASRPAVGSVMPQRRPDMQRQAPRSSGNFTEYNDTLKNVLQYVKDRGYHIRWPGPMRGQPNEKNLDRYCDFHRDKGHHTADYYQLKAELQTLADKGMLNDFIRRGEDRTHRAYTTRVAERAPIRRVEAEVSAPPMAPKAQEAQKEAVVNEAPEIPPPPFEVDQSGDPSRVRLTVESITGTLDLRDKLERTRRLRAASIEAKAAVQIHFNQEPEEACQVPSEEALEILGVIAGCKVKRMLVDTGSSMDVLFKSTFERMQLAPELVRPSSSVLIGFSGAPAQVIGRVRLPVTLGDEVHCVTHSVEFGIVDFPSPYNVILGRPLLAQFNGVASTCHQSLKFVAPQGIGISRGRSAPRYAREAERGVRRHRLNVIDIRSEEASRAESLDGELVVAIDEGRPERQVRISEQAPEDMRAPLIELLREFGELFAWSAQDMPGVSPEIAMHRLAVEEGKRPVQQKRRNLTQEKEEALRREVDKLLEAGFVEEARYITWLSNVVFVPKPSGDWRMCVDFTNLNRACPTDAYPMPRIDLLVDATAYHEALSFFDMFSGYHQIPMTEEDRAKTAFMTPFGNFCYKVMAFGLKNAGATYQRMVNQVFRKQLGRNVEAYVDDLIVKSKRRLDHLGDLRETFETMRFFKLRLNPKKCVFLAEAGKFLGFMITKRGIKANPKQVEAIVSLAPPRTPKEVQGLTGRLAALGRFIPRASDRGAPFFKVLKKASKFKWTEECSRAFDDLKKVLTAPTVTTAPKSKEVLYLYIAVSHIAVSAVLISREPCSNEERPVYYVSRTMVGHETRYAPIEKAALAVVMAANKLRPYFQTHSIVVLTNLPLRTVLGSMDVSGRLVKWAVQLSEFDISYAPRPAIKAQVLADFIAEGVSDGGVAAEECWQVHVDGAASRVGAGAGIVLMSPLGALHEIALRFAALKTNNTAEYEAVLAGLHMARELGAQKVNIKSDSALVVNQLNGVYEIKEESLGAYVDSVRKKCAWFREVTFTHVPREENAHADALSKLATALDFEENRTVIVTKEVPHEDVIMASISSGIEEGWMAPIWSFLTQGVVPEDSKEAWRLRRKAARCTIVDGTLYKRSHSGAYLRCLTEAEGLQAIKEVHQGTCGMHAGAQSLEKIVLRQGYYWPTIRADARRHVAACHQCQIHANDIHLPTAPMQGNVGAWPFNQWGMDLLGPLPKAPGQFKYLIVAVDYFTKWIEAEPLATITEAQVRKFTKKNIFARFGLPESIVTDHGKQFDCKKFVEFCDENGVILRFSSVAYPQANGQAEAANKSILHGLHTRLAEAKGKWVEELPSVLWAHRTTFKVASGETPFALTYGSEAVLPVEMRVPTYRMTHRNESMDVQERIDELDLLDERREVAALRLEAMKGQVARYYNKKMRAHGIVKGSLVLKRDFRPKATEGKLAPKWKGPYRVQEVVGPSTFKLQTLSGKNVKRTWNAQNLRKYEAGELSMMDAEGEEEVGTMTEISE
ncbi:unnamed protein product [Linum trigynum]|uniref:Uncharacterized protein n=1 Tax=Linum trigynum TaxID=586398 RepID=A0AAV2CCZ5_9ROSI